LIYNFNKYIINAVASTVSPESNRYLLTTRLRPSREGVLRAPPPPCVEALLIPEVDVTEYRGLERLLLALPAAFE